MTLTDFFERYAQTEAELQAYVATLPVWVNVWRAWMFFIFTAGIVFVLHKVEARWLALAMIASMIGYNVVSMASGVGRFPSIAFVLVWSPLAFYLAGRRDRLARQTRFDRVYAAWVQAALATLVISLTFDVYNVLYSVIRGTP